MTTLQDKKCITLRLCLLLMATNLVFLLLNFSNLAKKSIILVQLNISEILKFAKFAKIKK